MSHSSNRSAVAVVAILALFATDVEAAPLPTTLQAELVVRVASYDKGLRARAGENVRVLIVPKGSDDDAQWAEKLRSAFGRAETIGGLPHTESVVRFTSALDLAVAIRSNRIAIVVLPASLGSDVDAVRSALDGVNVLTVAPDSDLVKHGIVLGFELVSGKPRLFFNVTQASRQSVVMSADVMKLMTVVE